MPRDAIQVLKEDHEKLKKLLGELTETTTRGTKTRAELLRRIETEVKMHAKVEEEIFYPAFRKAGEKEEAKMFFEAKEEHRAVEDLVLPDLLKTDPGSEQFSGRAKVLKELIEHHAEEEEDDLFPQAKKVLSKEDLVELGERIEARKRELAGRPSARSA
jgi:hemerythrin-like domain-containing protein